MTPEALHLLGSPRGKKMFLSPPLTSDHLIRTKPFPLWIDKPLYDNEDKFRRQLRREISGYANRYNAYVGRYADELPTGIAPFDPLPRVILLPGMGAVCVGSDIVEAGIVSDITAQTLRVKTLIGSSGRYAGLTEEQLFNMEYMSLQHAKLGTRDELPLQRCIAVVTGAAGAIGSGICEELLKHGCHVAATDLAGSNLRSLVSELSQTYGERVIGVPLDVTMPGSVASALRQVTETWGGCDLLVANAGLAHVSPIERMDMHVFRRVQQVNVDGTLHLLAEAARHFRRQGIGGDIVLISTKNVFSPGAQFGAYSATKAAAHQLARVASLEFAEMGVRVNSVSPDAVFEHKDRKSGLWAEVGPDRMRARGLDERGLEEYYRDRNLLKSRVTATHVARAVLFFATRQTPTTGATIPVDGGLPDATPR
jgi:NAD(P)-dependent dehydrogenase (short-subunit alcohol dehydrogenase family)